MSGQSTSRVPASDILNAWSCELVAEPVQYAVMELVRAGYPRRRAYELVGDHLQRLGIRMTSLAERDARARVGRGAA